jgi:hypothetical protein
MYTDTPAMGEHALLILCGNQTQALLKNPRSQKRDLGHPSNAVALFRSLFTSEQCRSKPDAAAGCGIVRPLDKRRRISGLPDTRLMGPELLIPTWEPLASFRLSPRIRRL